MQEYKISRDEMETWCKVPVSQLEGHPDSKVKIIMRDTRGEVAELIGNLMAEELIANNKAGQSPGGCSLPAEDSIRPLSVGSTRSGSA